LVLHPSERRDLLLQGNTQLVNLPGLLFYLSLPGLCPLEGGSIM
jgi:hypothetical protein